VPFHVTMGHLMMLYQVQGHVVLKKMRVCIWWTEKEWRGSVCGMFPESLVFA